MPLPLWQTIKDALERDIAEGRFVQGSQLPTEAELAIRFAVNRHTVRRAIGEMREDGLVVSRRGAGVFVTATPVDYRLGTRTRFTQPLEEQGHTGRRQILRLEEVPCSKDEAALLEIPAGSPVCVMDSLGFINEVPSTHGQITLPVSRLAGVGAALKAHGSITAALRVCGIADYRRAWTRITAKRASASLARHLQVPDGAPLIRTRSLDVTLDGTPISLGRTSFCADRVELLVSADDEPASR